MNNLTIVLDIDDTLIHSERGADATTPGVLKVSIHLRPYLYEFLLYCFYNFYHVALWTAASPEWVQVVTETVLRPFLESTGKSFYFIKDRRDCVPDEQGILTKPFTAITNPFFDETSSIIVDDMFENVSMNGERFIIIPHFEGPKGGFTDDMFLLALTSFLGDIATHFRRYDDVDTDSTGEPWFIRYFESYSKVVKQEYTTEPEKYLVTFPNYTFDVSVYSLTFGEAKD